MQRGRRMKCRRRDEPAPGPSRPTERTTEPPPNYKITIDMRLGENDDTWLRSVKNLWTILKSGPNVTKCLHDRFAEAGDPYEEALRIAYNCNDFKDAKRTSLPYHVVEELGRWAPSQVPKPVPSVDVKMNAYAVVEEQRNSTFSRLVAAVYEFAADAETFVGRIRHSIRTHRYKEACTMASALNLYDRFTIEDFALPLILQDRFNYVKEYLDADEKARVDIVRFLDGLLVRKGGALNPLDQFLAKTNVPEIKRDKLHPKTLGKLLTRLMKTYDLPDGLAPNLRRNKNEGVIQFLVQRRFVHRTIGGDGWSEMVQEAVLDDASLQRELVHAINPFDSHEALRWARHYGVEMSHWPHNVRLLYESELRGEDDSAEVRDVAETWDPPSLSKPCLEFPLDRSRIVLVDDEAGFARFVDAIADGVTIVGLDSEWKPCFGARQNELSLMQIATRDRVFVVDVIALKHRTPALWKTLADVLFNNPDVLKLGFGLSNDTKIIEASLPHLGNIIASGPGYLDVNTLWRELMKTKSFEFPYRGDEVQGSGLSALCELCFDVRLDKSDQFSNWEKRPLRDGQLVYAALDAYCLILVYDKMSESALRHGVEFDELCQKIAYDDARRRRKTKHRNSRQPPKSTQIDEQPPSSAGETPVPARSVRVVCDTMVQGLARALRRCGIDAVFIDNDQDHMECVKIANAERRYVLTRGLVFNKLRLHVPQGHCYHVCSDTQDEQVEEVLAYYNVVVGKDDVFSRCQACNGDRFVELSAAEMKAVRANNVATSLPSPDGYGFENEYDEFDDDDDDYDDEDAPAATRNWILERCEKIDFERCLTARGARIGVSEIPDGVLDKVAKYYVCETCGKVYWDGSHFGRVMAGRLGDIVDV